MLTEKGQDPFLLIRREKAFAMMITIVGGVSAQIFLDVVAYGLLVFFLYFSEEGFKTVGRMYNFRLLVANASAVESGRWINGGTAYLAFDDKLAC